MRHFFILSFLIIVVHSSLFEAPSSSSVSVVAKRLGTKTGPGDESDDLPSLLSEQLHVAETSRKTHHSELARFLSKGPANSYIEIAKRSFSRELEEALTTNYVTFSPAELIHNRGLLHPIRPEQLEASEVLVHGVVLGENVLAQVESRYHSRSRLLHALFSREIFRGVPVKLITGRYLLQCQRRLGIRDRASQMDTLAMCIVESLCAHETEWPIAVSALGAQMHAYLDSAVMLVEKKPVLPSAGADLASYMREIKVFGWSRDDFKPHFVNGVARRMGLTAPERPTQNDAWCIWQSMANAGLFKSRETLDSWLDHFNVEGLSKKQLHQIMRINFRHPELSQSNFIGLGNMYQHPMDITLFFILGTVSDDTRYSWQPILKIIGTSFLELLEGMPAGMTFPRIMRKLVVLFSDRTLQEGVDLPTQFELTARLVKGMQQAAEPYAHLDIFELAFHKLFKIIQALSGKQAEVVCSVIPETLDLMLRAFVKIIPKDDSSVSLQTISQITVLMRNPALLNEYLVQEWSPDLESLRFMELLLASPLRATQPEIGADIIMETHMHMVESLFQNLYDGGIAEVAHKMCLEYYHGHFEAEELLNRKRNVMQFLLAHVPMNATPNAAERFKEIIG